MSSSSAGPLQRGLCIPLKRVNSALSQIPGSFNLAALMVVDLAVDRNSPVPANRFGTAVLGGLIADILAERLST
jgi:hypothetical protein